MHTKRAGSVDSDGYSSDNSDISMGSENQDGRQSPDAFGLLFDVDGVLARGTNPIPEAKKAIEMIKDSEGNLTKPVAFVTNACNRSADKAKQISKWFDIKVDPKQVIHAPSPLQLAFDLHDKRALVIGQEYRIEIVNELGFKDVCTTDDVSKAYPLLDMVDHDNRRRVAKEGYKEDNDFPKIEVILLIGEPKRWETDLQLLIDLLLTEGKPTSAPLDPHTVPQIPIIACNMDLVFQDRACMPRFGHGAFLVCLEALYKKITGNDLQYRNLVGKPCEATYRFAEHTVNDVAKRMGINKPLKKLYFFGDNPHVDIVGANLYDRFIKNKDGNGNASEIPISRIISEGEHLHEQCAEEMHSILVGTGVYKHIPESDKSTSDSEKKEVYHGHRDIAHEPHLTKPSKFVHNVHEGIQYIFRNEGISFNQ